MRYVSVSELRKGAMLERDIYDKNGILLLKKGAKLTEFNIIKLKELGYKGAIITEQVFENEDYYNSFVSHDLKYKISDSIAKMTNTISNEGEANEYFAQVKELVTNLVNEIMSQNKVKLNLLDLKLFDDYTFFHSINVAIISLILGHNMELNKFQLNDLGISAVLHDIGKLLIPPSVLNKPNKLTDKEFDLIKKHSTYGHEILQETKMFDEYIYSSVLSHHEKYNGTGYPNGLSGSQIPLYARIITIADVYDALTSKRVYRGEMFYGEVIEYIMSNSSVMFEPKITKAFLNSIHPFPIGTKVLLSNGDYAYVKQTNSQFILRPIIMLEKSKEVIDLSKNKKYLNITIVNIG